MVVEGKRSGNVAPGHWCCNLKHWCFTNAAAPFLGYGKWNLGMGGVRFYIRQVAQRLLIGLESPDYLFDMVE